MADEVDVVRLIGEDWEGVYFNGHVIEQNHSVRLDVILSQLVTDACIVRSYEEFWVEDYGYVIDGYLPEVIEGDVEEYLRENGNE